MRTAVISDIHGNGVALDAVLAELTRSPVDQVVCLGDAIQGGPQPAATVARLRELAYPIVMGNADAWLLSGEATGAEVVTVQQETVRAWSLAQLSAADQAFIAGFQPTLTLDVGEGRELLCFHGSPRSFDDIILPEMPDADVRRLLEPFDQPLLTGGHTHLQQIRRLGDTLFFNPGSAGLAYRHEQPEATFRADPWAEYAVVTVEDDRFSLEFRRVPFDVAALVQAYRTSGRPYADDAIRQYSPAPPS
jgi:predicted phosphodiesterase